MFKAVWVATLLCSLVLGCAKEDRAAVAGDVAEQWARQNVAEAAALVIDLVVEGGLASAPSPLAHTAKKALRSLVVDQVVEGLAWTVQRVQHMEGDLYRVTSHAGVTVEGTLPGLGVRSYTATLPFHILVNVENRTVETWDADLAAATVRSNP